MSLSSSSKPLVHWYKLQDSKAHCSPHQQEEEIELLKRWRFPTCLLSVPMSFFSSSKGFPHILDFLVLHSLLQWHRTCCPWNNQSKNSCFYAYLEEFPKIQSLSCISLHNPRFFFHFSSPILPATHPKVPLVAIANFHSVCFQFIYPYNKTIKLFAWNKQIGSCTKWLFCILQSNKYLMVKLGAF